MPKQWAVTITSPPALCTCLRLTLAGVVVVALSLVFWTEIWAHTPAATPISWGLACLLGVVLPLQLVRWGWRWLRACTGPAWLRGLATVAYLSGAALGLGSWLLGLLGVVGVVLLR